MKYSIKSWSKAKRAFAVGVATVAVMAATIIGLGATAASTQAASCPTNDIMPCGATSRTSFISKLKNNNPSDMDNIYADARYDLPQSQYSDFAAYAKAGRINPDNGNVTVDGKTIGYDGQSIGRNAKSVSRKISIDGKTYYESPIRLLTKNYNDALVLFDAKGNVQTVIMNICGNPISVKPNNPKYSCDALYQKQISRDSYEFTSKVSASNGASVVKVVYDFGDGTSRTENAANTVVKHSYAKPGSYTAKVTAYVKTTFGRGEFPITVTADCKKVVTVKEEEKPKVTIDKKVDGVDSKQVEVGQNFTYQLKVANAGNVNLANVVVKDDAPNNVQFISSSLGEIVNNKLVLTLPTLKVAGVVDINIVAKVSAYVPSAIKNTACVDVLAISGNPDDCDDATVTVAKPKVPHVKIDKLVNGVETDQVEVGEVFTYAVKATNDGEVDLENVRISDPAPAGVTLLTTDRGVITGNVMTHTEPSLKVNDSVTIKITAKATAYVPNAIVNTACVDASEVVIPGRPADKDDCNDATVTVLKPKVPGVSIDKVVNGVNRYEAKVGEVFTYTLTVKNTGEVELKNVVVTDPSAAGVTLLTTSKGEIANNMLSYTIDALPINAELQIKLTAKVETYRAGDMQNTACVDAPALPGAKNDCDEAVVTVPEPGKVKVCNPATSEIIWVTVTDQAKYEDAISDKCKPVKVCDPADGIIKDVKWVDKDKYELADSPKCVKIAVCVIADGTGAMTTISKDMFDASKYATKSADCRDVRVCRLGDKTMVTVKESVANTSAYSSNPEDCKTAPQVLPAVLPATGAGGAISIAAGVALVAGIAHRLYVSRKFARELQ